MIPAITEVNFPSYATLHQATVSLQDMGDRVISTQVRIDGDVIPDFSGWELRFKGERFVLPSDNPQAMKDNTTRNSLVDLQFQSWAIQELKRYYFFEAASVSAGVAIADKYVAPVRLNVEDFVAMLNDVLDYYFDGKIVADLYLSGTGIYSQEKKDMEINYSYLWEVIGKVFEVYGVRNVIEYDSTNDVYTIKFGYPADEIDDHTFEYGYQGGLLKFERQVQDETISNILLGRGGEKNLPYRYFKAIDPQNPEWAADPDAIPELANIYFDRLRDINFRRYVQGWRTNPNRDTSWEAVQAYDATRGATDWAYKKGHEDERFSPVEYVKDDASIAAYGEHWGALDDNDEIYPTIQGRSRTGLGRIDEVVAVSPIITDDIQAMAQASAVEKSISSLTVSKYGSTETTHTIESEEFTIPDGSTGNITYAWVDKATLYAGNVYCDTVNSSLVAVSSANGTELPISGIPAGTYRLRLRLVIRIDSPATSATGTFGIENIVLTTSAQDDEAWKPTFDIWVKDIWGIAREQGESDVQYAMRVWGPILGDRVGNEAKVVFSTGFMSVSEDYEFTIADYPVPDTTKTLNNVPSAWRITLRKSDAEYDATGLYIPNNSTGGKPIAGDKFFFTGIDMPHLYVTLAEEELNTFKSAQLQGTSAVNPTWVISLDKVRVHTLEDGEYGQTLAERLAAGAKLRVTDPRFSGGDILTLYAQSVTYTWNEPSDGSPYLVPDIEVVLSDQVVSRESRVDKIQSSVEQIKSQYARIDDVESVVRKVAEPMFLKKTGEADSSESPTQFSSKVTSRGFRQGGVGGTGWGFYRDNTEQFQESGTPVATRSRSTRAVSTEIEEGDSVLEVDRVVVRKEMKVNSLVVNQVEYRGGMEIISAAKIEISKVIDDDANGVYICYFDQRQNSVANNFQVGDVAYGHVFTPNDSTLRYYKCRVVGVDVDRIMLSKTVKDGAGVPQAGDVVVQFGSYTNSARRYVIVRDVVGGGYEQMLSGLDSVTASGEEYYYAGRTTGQSPRWFVGDAGGEYAEWKNGQLNIKGSILVRNGSTYSDLSGALADLDYLTTALPESSTLIQGGLILSKVIALTDAQNNIKSGINGVPSLSNIAAWYGGPMADKDDVPTPQDYAKSLFRFDGSGYLAGGNIYWDSQGYGGIPGITWSNDGTNDVVTIGGNVKLASVSGDSVTDMLNAVNSIKDWFEEVNLGTAQNPAWALRLKKKNGELNRAFVTYGDQIVEDGTPGGGGGGGVDHLYKLEDVYGDYTTERVKTATGATVSDGQALVWNENLSKWVAGTVQSGGGSVTSVGLSMPTGFSVSGSPVTSSGTLAVSFANGYSLPTTANQTAWSNKYDKPSGGIPKTDLASAVQDSLILADSALQSHQTVTLASGTNDGTLKITTAAGTTDNIAVTGFATVAGNAANGNTALSYFSSGVLPYNHGGTGLSSYTKGDLIYASANNTLSKLAANSTGTKKFLTMTSSVPSWGDIAFGDLPTLYWANVAVSSSSSTTTEPTVKSITIGGATFTWHPESSAGAGDAYLELNSAFVTSGDQIVGGGTPGGGGGGASYLSDLLDVKYGLNPSAEDLLIYSSSVPLNPDGTVTGPGWTTIAKSSVGRIYTGGTGITIGNDNTISVTANTYAPYNSAGYLPLSAGSSYPLTNTLYITLSATSTTPDIIAKAGSSVVSYLDIRTSDNKAANVGFISGSGWGVPDYGGAYLFSTSSGHAGGIFVNGDGVYYSNTSSNLDKYTVYHSGNFNPGDYLPLSGGTLSNSTRDFFKINSTNANGPYVHFQISGTTKGYIGYYEATGLSYLWLGAGTNRLLLSPTAADLRVGTDSTNYVVYHAGNLTKSILTTLLEGDSGYYVKKSGDTITSSSYVPLTLNSTSTVVGMALQLSGVTKMNVAFSSNTIGAYIQNAAVSGSPYVNLASDGQFKYSNNYVFYHSGNASISNSAITLGSTSLGTSPAPIGWTSAVVINGLTTEANITQDALRVYSGSGSTWAGSVASMAYAAILAIGGPSRGWQMWARREGGSGLSWRRGIADATAWEAERLIYDSANLTKSVLTTLLEGSNGYYVKKSGDTMTGKLLVSVNANDVAEFKHSGSGIGVVTLGSNGTYGTRLDIKNAANTGTALLLSYNGNVVATFTNSSASAAAFASTNSIAGNGWSADFLLPNLPANGRSFLVHGKAHSKNNAASVSFCWAADQSTSNYTGLGLYGNDDLLKVYGSGQTVITTTDSIGFVLKRNSSSGASNMLLLPDNQETYGWVMGAQNNTNNRKFSWMYRDTSDTWMAELTNAGQFNCRSLGVIRTSDGSSTFVIVNKTGTQGFNIVNSGGGGYFEFHTNISSTVAARVTIANSGAITTASTVTCSGIYVNQSASATATGVALWGTSSPATYGIYMATTANYGTHGGVTSSGAYATYFQMNGTAGRGWVWRAASTNVASINTVGLFTTNGDQVVSSDINLKTNLQPVKYTIEDIAKTRAVTFDWKDGRGHSAGSIAQDWKPLIPELVHGEEGNMTLAYGQIALVNTIIEAREIDVLKKRVAELEAEVQRLRMN